MGFAYNRVSVYDPEKGWQPDKGCAFFLSGNSQITADLATEIDRRWQGLRGIPGVESYQVMYSNPNELWVWVWGPFDAERVREFLVGTQQPVRLTMSRICCTSSGR